MSRRTIHPFPARMAPTIAIEALTKRAGTEPLAVLDPMCGSGTVLSAAVAGGHHATGIDIDPLAVAMSHVAVTPYDTDAILGSAARAVREARSRPAAIPAWHDPETQSFVQYWFGEQQSRDLARLAEVLLQVEDIDARTALQLGLSRIIVTKSPQASLASDTSHSRPHRTITESTYDVFAGYLASMKSLCRLLAQRSLNGTATVTNGDSRHLDGIADASVDLTITSPPYLNALDYLRGHKLSLIWFGHSIKSLRQIRAVSIGSEKGLRSAVPDTTQSTVRDVLATAVHPETLPVAMIARFAVDLETFAAQMSRVTRPLGELHVVVGNSTLKGNYIRNDELALRALLRHGFEITGRSERALPTSSRYLPITGSSSDQRLRNRMRSEVVLSLRKA